MSEVKVYTLVMGEKEILNFKHGEEQRLGQFVKYKDYAALETKCAALAAENALIKSAIPDPRDIDVDNDNMDDVSLAEDFGFNHAIELMRRRITETPATDAFLAEVRAHGVEMFCQYHNFSEKLFIQKEAQKFSAQLREGVDKK